MVHLSVCTFPASIIRLLNVRVTRCINESFSLLVPSPL